MTAIPKIKLDSVERFERDYKLRLPFRFGVITVTAGTQAVIRARIALEDGRMGLGVAAEALGAKWFDKDPAFSDAQNLDQLRQALGLAIELYGARGWSTPFGLYADTYREQLARGADLGLVPLVASYGPALLDRAILDALGRAMGLSFADMIRRNVPGIGATDLTPDLAGYDLPRFLDGLHPGSDIAVRHTVGLLDPIVASDQAPAERVDDGLPETLEEVVRYYRGRYYKLKVAGNIEADLARLAQIAAVLDRDAGDYRATLDGNEQYDDLDALVALWRRMQAEPKLTLVSETATELSAPEPEAPRGEAMSRSDSVDLVVEEVRKSLEDAGDAVVVDVRSREAFGAGHAPGALNVPLTDSRFPTKAAFVIPDGAHVALHAVTDADAERAARGLRAVGILELDGRFPTHADLDVAWAVGLDRFAR